MLPYQEDQKKLEKLLENLFEDDDESIPEDLAVLRKPIPPIEPFTNCCNYNYGSYGG